MINLFWKNLITFRYPIIINILLFIFYFIIASLTPYAADDFRYKLNPLDNEFSTQILADIINFQIWHYFNWSGRIIPNFLLQLFLVPSKYFFNYRVYTVDWTSVKGWFEKDHISPLKNTRDYFTRK